MKTFRIPLFLILASLACTGLLPRTAEANDYSFNFFYDQLEPYGEWVQVGDDYSWHPNGVSDDWRPYADGYWAYTDSGWTWVSYEDHGWITYHYGRWSYVRDAGWFWHPGYEWAPAWVSWRSGGDYVGWAPLPYGSDFRANVGIGIWSDSYYGVGPAYYNFCPVRSFGSPYLRPVLIHNSQNYTIIQNTVNITNITVNNNNVYVGGPQYSTISKLSKQKVPVLQLARVADVKVGKGENMTAKVQKGQLLVNAPAITQPDGQFKPEKIARKIDQPKIDKGWDMVKVDEKQKEKIQKQLHAEAKDMKPEDKPARAVSDSELKVVKEKSKTQEVGQPVDGGKIGKHKNEAAQPPGETVVKPDGREGKRKQPDTTAPLQPFNGDVPKSGRDKGGNRNKPIEQPVTIPGSEEKKTKRTHDGGQTGNADEITRKQIKDQEKANRLQVPSQPQDQPVREQKKRSQQVQNPYAGQNDSPNRKQQQQQEDVLRQQQRQMQKQQPQQIVQPQRVPSNPNQGQPSRDGGGKGGKKGKPTPYPNGAIP